MQNYLRPILWFVVCVFLIEPLRGADMQAEKALRQSERALEKLAGFRMNYRAFQEHIAGVPEFGILGSLAVQAGNRFYLTNAGGFFIFDSRIECVSDGTNFLSVMPGMPRPIQWEPKSVKVNFNESLVHLLVSGGITPVVALEIKAGLPPESDNLPTRSLPFLTNQFSISGVQLIGNETIGDRILTHLQLTFNDSTNEPVKMDLWLNKKTLLPVKRILHDRRAGDVIETYAFELNPSVPPDTFNPQRIIKERHLESAIRQMETPDALLLKACRYGDMKSAAEFLADGADPNARTLLVDRPPSFTGLMFAAEEGNLDLVKLLVKRGAEINALSLGGAPPLQFACMGGKLEIAEYLIEHGASMTNATSSLCWAARYGYSNIVILLLKKGVPADQPVKELGTPLEQAILGGFAGIAELLVKNGADINRTNNWGETPLHFAVRSSTTEMMKFLLKNGAKPNERDCYGMTPLMYAASDNHVDAAKLLLEHGANPQLKDSRGKTAMDMVSRHLPNKEIVTFFEQKGLIKAVQSNGKKP